MKKLSRDQVLMLHSMVINQSGGIDGVRDNEYLLREDSLEMQEGCGSTIDMFLGYFFIRKCMWSTPGTIKSTAASIKKFYKSMNDHGYVSKDDYNYLCTTIKENMEIWQEDCAAFNNFDE